MSRDLERRRADKANAPKRCPQCGWTDYNAYRAARGLSPWPAHRPGCPITEKETTLNAYAERAAETTMSYAQRIAETVEYIRESDGYRSDNTADWLGPWLHRIEDCALALIDAETEAKLAAGVTQ